MNAAVYTTYGPPEVLQIKEVPKPVPNPSEVLVRIHATTVNRTDTGLRSANYFVSRFFTGLFTPKRRVMGSKFAGEVVDVGSEVTLFAIGDKVFEFDDLSGGAHSDFMVEDENGPIALIPDGFSLEQMAATGEGTTYALNDIDAADIYAGDNVMVHAASGAITKAYLLEAIEVEKAGLQVEMKPTDEFSVPEEFRVRLDEDSALRGAFESLTPGRQRGHLLYFAAPKQSVTREARVEKSVDTILDGLGLND